MARLYDIAKVLRSKNAGALLCTLDMMFEDEATYRRVRPFFLGLIWGEIGMRLWWAAVAWWRGEMGGGYGM